jgi:hypothetical protein
MPEWVARVEILVQGDSYRPKRTAKQTRDELIKT